MRRITVSAVLLILVLSLFTPLSFSVKSSSDRDDAHQPHRNGDPDWNGDQHSGHTGTSSTTTTQTTTTMTSTTTLTTTTTSTTTTSQTTTSTSTSRTSTETETETGSTTTTTTTTLKTTTTTSTTSTSTHSGSGSSGYDDTPVDVKGGPDPCSGYVEGNVSLRDVVNGSSWNGKCFKTVNGSLVLILDMPGLIDYLGLYRGTVLDRTWQTLSDYVVSHPFQNSKKWSVITDLDS